MITTVDLTGENLIHSYVATSKGNQQKWFVNGVWYKSDMAGYEALAEVVVSRLLHYSDIDNFVEYHPVKIIYGKHLLNGCYSDNFKKENCSLLTLEHLSKIWLSQSFTKSLVTYTETQDRLTHTVNFVEEVTGLSQFGQYLTAMLQLDAFFLNEDRHTNNIAFLKDDETEQYSFCPYFDFGLSLLSDITQDYPLDNDVYTMMTKVKSKPFSRDFDEQTDAATSLFGNSLKLYFTAADIESVFSDLYDYYSESIIERVKTILLQQKNKYLYLFR